MPTILGIESTAHTFGVGIVKNGKILSNVISSFTTEKGGLIPMEVAKHHRENKYKIYSEALEKAKIKAKTGNFCINSSGKQIKAKTGNFCINSSSYPEGHKGKSQISEDEIDAIAFSQGPGLAPCLLEGIKFAKELSLKLKKPLVPVNHCVAHLEIGQTTNAKDPVMLYASGANTQIIAYASGKYRVFGETLDIGVGNFIDNFARYSGIGFPGGPAIEKLALQSKNLIELPYTIKGMDFAFSGILTNLKQKLDSKQYNLNELAYSLQENVFAMLVESAERALAHTGKNELLLAGGVACNKRLQEMCRIMCGERGAKFFCPEKQFLIDNAGMIAYLGEIMYNSGIGFSYKNLDELDIKPRQRTDEVEVKWK